MTSNTELWDKLGKTDPAHTKTFKRAGGFSGTAIKPMWSYRRMTEEFGPCGKGWGISEPSFQVVPTGETVLVFCTVSVWYEKREQSVFGVGGDMAAGKRGQHSMVDDEAFKKAFTDAVTNALKLIGVGADVHMGMFDDNKYVNTMAKEFSEAAKPEAKLSDIDAELLNCHSEAAIKASADSWHFIASRDGWSREQKLAAKAKFDARRVAISDPVDTVKEMFPGAKITNERITNTSGRELEFAEAGE